MRAALLLTLFLSATAHAMGADITFEICAWSPDGTSALVKRSSSQMGNKRTSYSVVTAGAQPIDAETSAISDEGKEMVSPGSCAKALGPIADAVKVHGFHDVTVKADRCAVSIGASNAPEVEASWVAIPQGRKATAREQAAIDALTAVAPDYKLHVQPIGEDGPCADQFDAASRTGKLVLVVKTPTLGCGAPFQMSISAVSGKNPPVMLQ